MIGKPGAFSYLRLPLAVCVALATTGCAHGTTQHRAMIVVTAADRRLVPPDLVWTLSDGARIPLRVWQPGKRPVRAVLLALHGMDDSRDAFEIPGPLLAARGIAVYAPDQRGFGQAPGRGRWPGSGRLVSDAAEMVGLAASTHPGLPVYVLGESMGGAVAMCVAALRERPPIAGFVLMAPAVWSSTEMSPVLTASLWAAATFAPDWPLTGRDLPFEVQASDNLAALVRLSYDPLTLTATRTAALRGLVDLMTRAAACAPRMRGRVLIGYGAHDELVPAAAMAASWARLPPGARRAYYAHGYHLLLRDRDRAEVVGDVVTWMTEPGQALPSGAGVAAASWVAGASWEEALPALLPANLDDLAGAPASGR